MSFKKKFKKLCRTPRAFFADSKNSFVQMIIGFSRPTQQPLSAGGSAKLKVVKATQATQTKKSQFEEVRSMGAAFSACGNSIDLWGYYRAADQKYKKNHEEGRPVVAIYPLGVPVMDIARDSIYKHDGCATFFLPLWEHIDGASDLDDLEYRTKKEPLIANLIAQRALATAVDRNAVAVVLPYDATPLTRAMAIQSRALGLVTICHFPFSRPVLQFYGGANIASFPICDWLAVDELFAKSLPFAETVMKSCSLIPSAYSKKEREDFGYSSSCQLRTRIGVGAVDEVYLLALPPLQFGLSNEYICEISSVQIEKILSRMGATAHLLLVIKRRKRGAMNNNAVELLRKKYRKTVVFYDDDVDLDALLSVAKEAILPVGLLPAHCYDDAKITLYDFGGPETEISECVDSAPVAAESYRKGFCHPGFDKLINSSHHKTDWLCSDYLGSVEKVFDRILDSYGPGLNLIAVPDPINNLPITDGRQKYLLELLHADKRIYGAGHVHEANMAEAFIQWGAEPSESKERPEVYRSFLGRPRLYLEDGFIRSQGLWTNPDEPTLSVVIDTRAIYYNSMQPSLLETILDSDFKLSSDQLSRAKHLINAIVRGCVSKYNYAPVIDLDFRSKNKRTILIVDQKAGDMSIKYGNATDESFYVMLQTALDMGEGVEIVIKQHPCAITGGDDQAHFTAASLGAIAKRPNVHLIGFDVNPYSLINAVDEVWVVSSGMGFEALMAGKSVRCFGVPFYANWGVTKDEVKIDRRRQKRTVEEIFYVFYVLLSRYVDPDTGKICEIERLVEYFSQLSAEKRV